MNQTADAPRTEIVLYQTEDGQTRIHVRTTGETVWLTVEQMAELFQRDRTTILRHVANVFAEGEVEREATCADFAQVQTEGSRTVTRKIPSYNLDVIISVGYRVKSLRGTQFRRWALSVLREYLVNGFAMNDELLKQAGGGTYWRELLSRIRDIRRPRRCSTVRCSTCTPPVSTTTRARRRAWSSSPSSRTRCTTRRTATPRPRSSISAPTPPSRSWG